MAKAMSEASCWMEVAPPPLILPSKPSNSPALETIAEEDDADHDYGDDHL